jgi:hypothetical protein
MKSKTQFPPLAPVVSDAEEALQERADWLVDAFMWCVTYAPLLPLLVYCAAVALTAIGIIVHQFTR